MFDSTNLTLASEHRACACESTILVVVEDRTCSSTVRLVNFTTDLHGVVTLREYVATVAPLPTVDVMSVTVVRMTVTRQSLNKTRTTSQSEEETAQT